MTVKNASSVENAKNEQENDLVRQDIHRVNPLNASVALI